ncbi:MAG: FixH family protein [Candidatus Rokuibacteriota bacterium]
MNRVLVAILGALLVVGTLTAIASSAEKVIQTHKAKDVTITLKNDGGQLTKGKNSFVLEFTSPDNKPVDVGKVAVQTTMTMPGMAPMSADATLKPDGPGRYRGAIAFPDTGTRQTTVTWDGPAGKGSAKFSLPVR